MATFSSFIPNDLSGNCFCLEPLSNGPCVVHSGPLAYLHPMHTKCVKLWSKTAPPSTCPHCRKSINTESLFTWKERNIIKLKELARPIGVAIGVGAVTAVAAVAITLVLSSLITRI